MKELILIGAYCPNIEHQDLLRNLVRQLSDYDKDILLVSHSIIPEDIVKQCKFYFYDEENKFPPDDDLKFFWWCDSSKGRIESKDPILKSSTILPVYRIILFGLGIAKILGYKYIHYLEYDAVIKDINFINNNTEILKEGFGNISYRFTNHHNQEVVEGCYSAYNTDFYSFEDLIYNEETILSKYKQHFPYVELMSRIEYLDPFTPYIKTQKDLEKEGLLGNLYFSGSPVTSYIVPFLKKDGTFFIYHHRINLGGVDGDEIIEIIIDDYYFRVGTAKEQCRFIPTMKLFSDISHFKVIKDGKTVLEYQLSNPEEKERFLRMNKILN